MQTSIIGEGGAREMSLEAVLSGRRIIYLEGPIENDLASSFARQVIPCVLRMWSPIRLRTEFRTNENNPRAFDRVRIFP